MSEFPEPDPNCELALMWGLHYCLLDPDIAGKVKEFARDEQLLAQELVLDLGQSWS